METGERVSLVDVAKGLSILLVVLGHSHILDQMKDINQAFSSFRMPFFFFLSGIFFKPQISFWSTFLSKSDSLLKPYFFTLFIVACLNGNSTEGISLWRIAEIMYGVGQTIKSPWSPLWFLPHLWLIFMFSWFFIRFGIYRKYYIRWNFCLLLCLLAAANLTVGMFWKQNCFIFGAPVVLYGLPFSVDIVPVSLFFFLLGYELKEKVKRFKPSLLIFSISIASFVALHVFFDVHVDLNGRVYRTIATAPFVALCGIYFSLSIAYFLDKMKPVAKVFSYIGSRSLFLLLFHAYFLGLFYREYNTYFLIAPLLSYLLSIIASIFLAKIIYSSSLLSIFFRPLKNNNLLHTTVLWLRK